MVAWLLGITRRQFQKGNGRRNWRVWQDWVSEDNSKIINPLKTDQMESLLLQAYSDYPELPLLT